jgi:outer membrane protein insertion porin family
LAISGALPEKINIDDIKKNILVSEGQVFNRKLINTSSKNISNLLGNYGYAFANVNPVPNVDKDNLIVDFNFTIDQGKKIYVRRINIIGNETTKDEVIRRELRQYESSWFSQEKIDLSKQRLNRTQYFEAVNVETPIVPGNPDQVDINVLLKETNTGKFQIGAGVSSSEGIVGSLSLSQSNFLGTGNTISTEVSTGGINKVWSLRFIDPYWTEDGVSRGFNAYYQDYDTKELKTGDYQSKSYGLGIDFGIPLDEFKRFNFGGTFDFTELNLKSDSPQKYKDYCANLSGAGSMSCQADSFLLFTSWSDNNLDNPFFPTTGYKISANFDITTPGLDLEYYKASLKGEKFYPLSSSVTTKIRGAIGYADRYGDEVYPIFKNFKVGGKSSIRGYKEGSVGKKTFDSSSGRWVTYGGRKMFSFGAETYFPVPFVEASESYRMSIFFDGGATFEDSLNGGDIRYSAGLGGLWMSPFGPLSVSIAMPLNDGEHDQQEKFQFGMGSSF